jgi:hypothetical protein
MDALRARAYLDILLGMDSRPPGRTPDGTVACQDPAQPQDPDLAQLFGPGSPAGGPLAGMIPPGFAGHVTLTIPAATLTRRAGRPGELTGIGPVDPDLARELATTAARNPRSTWHVTVTDRDGHAVAHGCARPVKRRKPGGHGPARGPDPPGEPGFTFTPTGPGTWRLTAGDREMLVIIEALPGRECDHRHQARGHDPGVLLRHLTEVRHATCTGPGCRRPAARSDFEHNPRLRRAGGPACATEIRSADPTTE